MPRFVLLEHSASPRTPGRVHWDLLLQAGPTPDAPLLAWELAAQLGSEVECQAARLPDHRPLYLEFEGALSEGRGVVRRVASGSYTEFVQETGRWSVQLNSPELCGTLTLELVAPTNQRWRASFRGS